MKGSVEYFEDDETGIPVSVAAGRAIAFDVPGGRPFPGAEVSSLVRVSRERFDELREMNASNAA